MLSEMKKSPILLEQDNALSPLFNELDGINTNNNSKESKESCQDSLQSELDSVFIPKKKASLILAKSYDRLRLKNSQIGSVKIDPYGFDKKYSRVADCGSYLVFRKEFNNDTGEVFGKARLNRANFCEDRLCPQCGRRRTLKIYSQVSRIMDNMPKVRYIFLTLTVPNCIGEDLNPTIDRMYKAFYRFKRRGIFKSTVLGFMRALEITKNNNPRSKSFGTYHPHFHCVLAVPADYGPYSENYIERDTWLKLWRESYKDDSIIAVDVRFADLPKNKNHASPDPVKDSIREIAKYSVKGSDYLGKYDKDGNLIKPYPNNVIDDSVFDLSLALRNRRLIEFGGIMYDMHKKLNLDDPEDGDLINIDNENINPMLSYVLYHYHWGAGTYQLINQEVINSEQ